MEKVEIFILITMTMAASILMMCALVLYKGGLYFMGEYGGRRNTLQNLFCAASALCALTFIPAIINDFILTAPNPTVSYFVNTICVISMGFIPLEAYVLRQIRLTARHWIIVFWPATLMLLVPIFGIKYLEMPGEAVQTFSFLYFICLTSHSYYKLRKWDEQMEDEYSDVARKQTKWFRSLSLPLFLVTFLWIPVWIFNARWIYIIYYLLLSWLFIRFTIYALRQEECILPDKVENTDEESTDYSELPSWAGKMDAIMAEEHIYRNESLSSSELATILGTNRTYLSRYLNECKKVNFYDYVNSYRLDEAEVLLRKGEQDLAGIAYSCGFRDREAFYRCFRRRHGMSPTEWLKGNV